MITGSKVGGRRDDSPVRATRGRGGSSGGDTPAADFFSIKP
jgi:hypothetical protein